MRNHPVRLAIVIVSLSVTAAASAGCSSSTAEQEAPPGMRIDKVCVETACDAKHKRDNDACSRCMNACFDASFNCDPSQSCKASCSTTSCRDEERSRCEKEGFRAELGTWSNDEVEAACQRVFDHFDSCQIELPGLDGDMACFKWARTHRPEAAQVFDCFVEAGCSGDVSACELPSTTLGDEVCEGIASVCGETLCTPATKDALNAIGALVRDDVAAALRYCAAQESCGDAIECFDAWVTATQP